MPHSTLLLRFGLLGAAALLLAGCASSVAIRDGRVYHSGLRLSIAQNPAWTYVSYQDQNAAARRLDSTNKLATRWAKFSTDGYQLLLAKPSASHGPMDSTLGVALAPHDNVRFRDPVRLSNEYIATFRFIFPQAEIVSPPIPTKVGGRDAAYYHLRYVIPLSSGQNVARDRHVWVVSGPLAAIVFDAATEQSEPLETTAELQAMIQSVRFGEP
jgi:hypothetical protein